MNIYDQKKEKFNQIPSIANFFSMRSSKQIVLGTRPKLGFFQNTVCKVS